MNHNTELYEFQLERAEGNKLNLRIGDLLIHNEYNVLGMYLGFKIRERGTRIHYIYIFRTDKPHPFSKDTTGHYPFYFSGFSDKSKWVQL